MLLKRLDHCAVSLSVFKVVHFHGRSIPERQLSLIILSATFEDYSKVVLLNQVSFENNIRPLEYFNVDDV